MEFQNTFFQMHHLFPDIFYYQLLFDVLLENTVIGDMLGIHVGNFKTKRLNQSYFLILLATMWSSNDHEIKFFTF